MLAPSPVHASPEGLDKEFIFASKNISKLLRLVISEET